MTVKDIVNKQDLAIQNLNQENFIENFPNILNDIQYIYYGIKSDRSQLSEIDDFLNGLTITEKSIEYSALLVKQYIKLKYNIDLKIEKNDTYDLSMVSGGYSNKEDVIKYSTMGISLGSNNTLSFIQTFLHEARHKIQHTSYNESDVSELLKFPPNMIILAKDYVFESSNPENNREFYIANYNNLYFEIDAEMFSIETLKNMLLDLFYQYEAYAKKNKIKISKKILLKVKEIVSNMSKDIEKIEEKTDEMDRVDPAITKETYGLSPIESTYNIHGEEIDRLVVVDKYIKNYPELQTKMPIFKLIFNGDNPKTYEEIMKDKQTLLNNHKDLSYVIEELYGCIIKSDPILYLTDLVMHEEKEAIIRFIDKHQTIFLDYPLEIQEIIEKYHNDEILCILTDNQKNKQKK